MSAEIGYKKHRIYRVAQCIAAWGFFGQVVRNMDVSASSI